MSDWVKKLWTQRDRVTRAMTVDGTFRAAVVHNATSVRTAQERHGLDGVPSLVLAVEMSQATSDTT